jgi:hypothetical protein
MRKEDVKIGQLWMRKNGQIVRIEKERDFIGTRDFLLVPIGGKGRKSWKWDGGIVTELTYHGTV